MKIPEKKSTTIIGSGLAGSFLAVLLARRGYQVTIYEKLSRNEICDIASKRSYNIVLFGYGITMLQKAGVWEAVKPFLQKLNGSVTHIAYNKPVTTLTDENMPYFTIERARLAQILLNQAACMSSVTIHYDTSLTMVNRHERTIVVRNLKTNHITDVQTDVLIGADGANSLVRSFIQQGLESKHTQEYADWVYKEFAISGATVDKLHLAKKFVHTWTQKKAFIIMHPAGEHKLAALFVYPKKQEMNTPGTIEKFFEENFPDLTSVLTEITRSLTKNPAGTFATIHTNPWYYKNFITIIGDAAHGFYPFFGQGTSAAFGDCMALINLIDKYGNDWGKIFPLYQETRKRHTDALGELSKEVLLKYLRYKKADYDAIYDKFELSLYRRFPGLLQPPLFQRILMDPEHAADHRANDLRQKKIARMLGISLVVTLLSRILSFFEEHKKRSNSRPFNTGNLNKRHLNRLNAYFITLLICLLVR
jgi:kynurenine 3-monooxygenase